MKLTEFTVKQLIKKLQSFPDEDAPVGVLLPEVTHTWKFQTWADPDEGTVYIGWW